MNIEGRPLTADEVNAMLEARAKEGNPEKTLRVLMVRYDGKLHYLLNPEGGDGKGILSHLVNPHPNPVSMEYLRKAESIMYYEIE